MKQNGIFFFDVLASHRKSRKKKYTEEAENKD